MLKDVFIVFPAALAIEPRHHQQEYQYSRMSAQWQKSQATGDRLAKPGERLPFAELRSIGNLPRPASTS
jgi:hypothetical protein